MRVVPVLAGVLSLLAPLALAQPKTTALSGYKVAPAGLTTIYDAPTKVNLAGRPVIADIALHADQAAAKTGSLKLALTTDVTKFVKETETDLKNYIAGRYNDCGERWSSSDPKITFPNNAIRFQMTMVIEYWQCGWNGKGKPGRMTRDGGSVDVTLIPYVETGKLQAKLGKLDITVTDGLGKYMPLETLVRTAVNNELKKLNDNPKFYRAPNPLYAEMFRYESMASKVDAQQRVIITARYFANGKPAAFDRVVAKMKSEGVTQ